MEYKTIALKQGTFERLAKWMHYGDTADSGINRILDLLETSQKPVQATQPNEPQSTTPTQG